MGKRALRENKTDEMGHFEKTNWNWALTGNKTRLVVVVGYPPPGSDADLLDRNVKYSLVC